MISPGNAARELISTQRLAEFFAPRSIALVGASETSGWARFIVAASSAVGYQGPLLPVHPTHSSVFGRPAVPSLRDLPEPADLAFVLAPTGAVSAVLDDAAAADIGNVVILASGYRETGQDGRAREDELVAQAARHGIVLLGPNCLGFVNMTARTAPFALSVPQPMPAGPVGIALQSGALSSALLGFARSHAIGVSIVASLGNEAMITTADVLDFLIADEQTRVICLFLEQITDPAAFSAAAQRADQAGKPIVALKAGASAPGQAAALAHTGAVAGDDAVVEAALRQLNIVRVTSIEEMLTTAALLGYHQVPRGRRMGVVTASGGACGIIADRASTEGIEIPPFAPETTAAIAAHLPPFAAPRNPLDVTGYVLANARTSPLTAIDHALDAALADPGLDFVIFTGFTVPETRPADEGLADLLESRIGWLADRVQTAPIPAIPLSLTCVDVSGYARKLLDGHDVHLVSGIDVGVRAIGHALRWGQRRGSVHAVLGPSPDSLAAGPAALPAAWLETRARELLSAAGIPVVPGRLVHSAAAAVAAADELGRPVALKICASEITHKSDVGGVVLGARTDDEIRAAYEQVASAAPGALSEAGGGVLVTAMRTGGVELLAGVRVDPQFGPVLAVGLGGVFVEVLGDVSLRVLPVDAAEVARMLGELRGHALLAGARGSQPADISALAKVISEMAALAASVQGLAALEANPLWVSGDQIEALDVLVLCHEPNGAG